MEKFQFKGARKIVRTVSFSVASSFCYYVDQIRLVKLRHQEFELLIGRKAS